MQIKGFQGSARERNLKENISLTMRGIVCPLSWVAANAEKQQLENLNKKQINLLQCFPSSRREKKTPVEKASIFLRWATRRLKYH